MIFYSQGHQQHTKLWTRLSLSSANPFFRQRQCCLQWPRTHSYLNQLKQSKNAITKFICRWCGYGPDCTRGKDRQQCQQNHLLVICFIPFKGLLCSLRIKDSEECFFCFFFVDVVNLCETSPVGWEDPSKRFLGEVSQCKLDIGISFQTWLYEYKHINHIFNTCWEQRYKGGIHPK